MYSQLGVAGGNVQTGLSPYDSRITCHTYLLALLRSLWQLHCSSNHLQCMTSNHNHTCSSLWMHKSTALLVTVSGWDRLPLWYLTWRGRYSNAATGCMTESAPGQCCVTCRPLWMRGGPA